MKRSRRRLNYQSEFDIPPECSCSFPEPTKKEPDPIFRPANISVALEGKEDLRVLCPECSKQIIIEERHLVNGHSIECEQCKMNLRLIIGWMKTEDIEKISHIKTWGKKEKE